MPPPKRPGYLRSLSSYTQRNKPRLYVALYPRGGSESSFTRTSDCESYHWALIVGPQTASRSDAGTRYHIAHSSTLSFADSRRVSVQSLVYEENDLPTTPSAQTMLVRIAVAKVINADYVRDILRSLPVAVDGVNDTCLAWVQNAFTELHSKHGCLKSYLCEEDWKEVEMVAREYCKRKREQRRWTDADGPWDMGNVSTYTFWQNRETMP
ncbi:hypothetical protein K431DRAFT_88585 [Polychaeton citri CBS 116435]|uniref:Uncharacterized protein n=1 Tax=Polychaeton citri CBS 116435 TaxID=1314669 RepID=A0A9P4UNG2_9PEZI|nr:hypothetical protein K431DRAFT_88585 [Polychaeton citri CBS 116435]